MKVGVNLINFGPGADPDSLARLSRLSEALGYHFLMVSDHVAITPDVAEQYPAPFYDPFVTLSWLAGITHRVELGTTVIVLPYRHPLQVANMAAGVDRLSNGRFILGVGTGWAKQEYEALGVSFEKRGAMTNDYLAAIKALWTDDVASHVGPFVSFREVHSSAGPVPSPHPPIWVGGSSEAALRRAIRYGDGWHPLDVRIDWLKEKGLPRLEAIAREEERPVPSLCPRIKLRLTESPLDEEVRLAGEGTLGQVRRDLESLKSLGAEYVLLDPYIGDPKSSPRHELGRDMLATLAEKVLDLENQNLRYEHPI